MTVKTRIVQQIFVFLLLTVGIVYLVQYLGKSIQIEGFISPEEAEACATAQSKCSKQSVGGTDMYLCNDLDEYETGALRAETILDACSEKLESVRIPNNQVLFKDTDTACFRVNDRRTDSSFYTCFQRPPPIVYNDNTGATEFQKPIEDSVPYALSTEIPSACSAYQTSLNMVIRAYAQTSTNKAVVDSAITVVVNSYDTLIGLSTANCAAGVGRTPLQTSNCTSLQNFLGSYVPGPTGTLSTLYGIQTILGNSLTSLQTTYTAEIKPSFQNFCPPPKALLTPPPGFAV